MTPEEHRASDILSVSEAAEAVGISVSTLNRFVEAGCLIVETERNGVPYFSCAQVSALFGKAIGGQQQKGISDAPSRSRVWTPEVISTEAASEKVAKATDVEDAPYPLTEEDDVFDLDEASKVIQTKEVKAELSEANLGTEAREGSSSWASLRETLIPESNTLGEVERIQELLKVISFQDSLLSDRENEIRDLKIQRDWLKQRIEKLEERSEQSSLLLMAETHAIRRLLTTPEPRKSLVRSCFEILGLSRQPTKPSELAGKRSRNQTPGQRLSHAQATQANILDHVATEDSSDTITKKRQVGGVR